MAKNNYSFQKRKKELAKKKKKEQKRQRKLERKNAELNENKEQLPPDGADAAQPLSDLADGISG